MLKKFYLKWRDFGAEKICRKTEIYLDWKIADLCHGSGAVDKTSNSQTRGSRFESQAGKAIAINESESYSET